jgi:hypothetical protein
MKCSFVQLSIAIREVSMASSLVSPSTFHNHVSSFCLIAESLPSLSSFEPGDLVPGESAHNSLSLNALINKIFMTLPRRRSVMTGASPAFKAVEKVVAAVDF